MITLTEHNPYSEGLLDPQRVRAAVLEALVYGDLEAVRDVLIAHISIRNKSELAIKAKIGRQTIYDLMNMDKEFNPSIKTLAAILDQIAA